MKMYRLAFGLPLLSPLACGTDRDPGVVDDSGAATTITTAATAVDTGDGTAAETTPTTGNNDGTTAADGTTAGSDEDGPKWDVGGAVIPGECEDADAGIFCKMGVAIECDGNGNTVSSDACLPDICVEGVGCVQCLDGQYHCSGPRVMTCNAAADPPHWVEVDVCDPAAGEGCDQELGSCEILQVLGTNIATGAYYQYASFMSGATAYQGGFDVDSYEDRMYVTDLGGNHVDVYQVALLDSDGDGMLEPNQHPDNPDDTGPIEARTIVYVESIPNITVYDVGLIASEIYAIDDRMYVGGASITEYVFGMAGGTPVTTAPAWSYFGTGVFSQIGYDDMNEVWYASNEAGRRVLQHDAETNTWGIAFLFPDLAGSHMDGLEIVTDPNTGTPYVYVSDMTSDFIGQYRLDDEVGWVQENLFQYAGTVGESVEGMGFGYLNHFWVTGYQALYEIGGGDLATYTEPTPTG
jgi:hypothetical protein